MRISTPPGRPRTPRERVGTGPAGGPQTQTRVIAPGQVPAVAALARRDLGEDAAPESEFEAAMGTRGAYPWVVLLDGRPAAGLLALPAGRRTLLIRQLFVDPEFRGLGLAAGLVEALKGVLAGAARSRLVALVREDDLDSQVFYRGLDFVCETTLCGRATGHVPLYRFAHAAGPRLRPS